jgi:hypothetical protein
MVGDSPPEENDASAHSGRWFFPTGMLLGDDTPDTIEQETESWGDLSSELMAGPEDWIFRGQEQFTWQLTTSLQRALKKVGAPVDQWRIRENSCIGFFKDHARIHLATPLPDEDLIGWLSAMQHYRAPTRFLDWSQSPFVAMYFAVAQQGAEDAALWALSASFLQSQHGTVGSSARFDHFAYPSRDRLNEDNTLVKKLISGSIEFPLPVMPWNVDARMAAQQGLFTVSGALDERPLEELLKPLSSFAAGSPVAPFGSKQRHFLIKFRIPATWRREILRSLSRMGITAGSLFPGLDGVGEATTLHLDTSGTTLRDQLMP